MKAYQKAIVYVLLAALAPVVELMAVSAKNHVWPDQYELAYCGCAALMAGLVTLKAFTSDPSDPSKKDEPK